MHLDPTISFIVPVGKCDDLFTQSLNALQRAVLPPDDVILVFDGISPPSGLPPSLRTRVLPERRGPASARNAGADLAEGDIICFLDADVAVNPRFAVQVRSAFRRHSDITAVIGSYDDSPQDPRFLAQFRNLLHHHTHQMADRNAGTFWGACGAIRSGAFRALGGFDESYRHPCIEDIELGYRLTAAGHRIALDRTLTVCHLKRWRLGNLIHTDLLRRAVPWARLNFERRTWIRDLTLSPRNRWSVFAVAASLASMGGAVLEPRLLWVSACAMSFLLYLNLGFYRLLRRKRGSWFAIRALPIHVIHFLICGTGFFLGWLLYASHGPAVSPADPEL